MITLVYYILLIFCFHLNCKIFFCPSFFEGNLYLWMPLNHVCNCLEGFYRNCFKWFVICIIKMVFMMIHTSLQWLVADWNAFFKLLYSWLSFFFVFLNVSFLQQEDGTKVEYRVWNPFRSKLAAAILGGVDNIWIVSILLVYVWLFVFCWFIF